jgi:hypothetical protein
MQRSARIPHGLVPAVSRGCVVDWQPFDEITPERLDKMNRININGSVWCAQAALKTVRS